MQTIDFIKEVEQNYDVASIKINGLEVWPFLRRAYFFAYNDKSRGKSKKTQKASFLDNVKRINNTFYGLWNLINKYDYLVFSDVLEIRLMNGRHVNKLADYLISELGRDQTLLIENPADGTYFKRTLFASRDIISLRYFTIICDFLTSSAKNRFRIDNEEILKEINRKYSLNVNYHQIITLFFCYNKLLARFFKRIKPKLIVISDYYTLFHQAVIYTSKTLGINTIELQHGIINKSHGAYNVFTKLDNSFFPDYLLVFGDYVKKVFQNRNYFIEKDHVMSIGNMYIDYINNEYAAPENINRLFSNLRKKYKKIVAISSQWTIEDKLIDFLKSSAKLNKNILYIFVPRNVNKDYSYAKFPENIIILKDLNVYQIIKESDFHTTGYSSCSLEAPALGVPNILINLNGMAKRYYSEILKNQNVTKFIETEEEFVNTILTWQIMDNKKIISLHDDFYKQDHKANIKKVLGLVKQGQS